MKNHAFLIPVHKQPKLLHRLLKVLENSNHYFYISIDAKTGNYNEFVDILKDIHNIHILEKRIDVKHAGFSQLMSYIELIKAAKNKAAADFDYYHFISGQDYPLRSNKIFDDFFEHTNHSFAYLNDEKLCKQLEKAEVSYLNHYNFDNVSSLISRIYLKLKLDYVVGLFFPRKPIQGKRGGWDWASWEKRTFDYIYNYIETHPEYVERYKHTRASVEYCFNTLLAAKVKELNIEESNPLRYISWHPHRQVNTSYRPFILNEQDYEFVIDSKAFFCRKVDELESAKLLDMIDTQRDNDYDINEHTNFV